MNSNFKPLQPVSGLIGSDNHNGTIKARRRQENSPNVANIGKYARTRVRWNYGGCCIMYYWSVLKAAEFAKMQTAKAASVKAWRITTKAGKALQEIARQMAACKGYEIATDAEIFAKYGDLYPIFKVATVRDNKRRIWCIYTDVADSRGRVSLSVVCVR